jgi:hypothetical protein
LRAAVASKTRSLCEGVCARGFDFLSLSKGGKFEDAQQPKVGQAVYPYTGQSGYECMPTVLSDAIGPFGRSVPLVAAIKKAVNESGFNTPIVARAAYQRLSRPKRSCVGPG